VGHVTVVEDTYVAFVVRKVVPKEKVHINPEVGSKLAPLMVMFTAADAEDSIDGGLVEMIVGHVMDTGEGAEVAAGVER